MILFTILLTMLIAIAVVTAILAIVGAGSFALAFGDVIVFGLLFAEFTGAIMER